MAKNVCAKLMSTVSGLRRSMLGRRWPVVAAAGCLLASSAAEAAELSAGDLKMRPNGIAKVVVSGEIDGEWTFGWSIMVELIPREGSSGTVTFTTVPPGPPPKRASFVVRENPGCLATVRLEQPYRPGVDIKQMVDVWADQGTFTTYDTERTGSSALNGAVDENGTLVAAPVAFSGPLAVFPVVASPDAAGVWDVSLSTWVGDSSWEGIETQLMSGSITISHGACSAAWDCDDGDPCTDDVCDAGTCRNVENSDSACRERELSRKRNGKGEDAGDSSQR
jgi:hypothetical protein